MEEAGHSLVGRVSSIHEALGSISSNVCARVRACAHPPPQRKDVLYLRTLPQKKLFVLNLAESSSISKQ